MISQARQIQTYILRQLPKHPADIVLITAKHFNVTRTTVHRHLNQLIKAQKIIKSGTTRNIQYILTTSFDRFFRYQISSTLSEFNVLTKDFKDILKRLPLNTEDICSYGFTEIFNNAIDHAKAKQIIASTSLNDDIFTITIEDDGIGVFKKLFDYFKLDDIRESILQLNKGKMTTDPANHTGEGIFFSARAFDVFEIYANNLHYIRDNSENDWAIESIENVNIGSRVVMSIKINSPTSLVNLFKKYQEPEDFAFDRTDIVVALSRFGDETLMSRSQAKRITRGLDKFRHVTLDFTNVRLIGQGFVDELFRVYANAHPDIEFKTIHTNPDVEFMIKRGLSRSIVNPNK